MDENSKGVSVHIVKKLERVRSAMYVEGNCRNTGIPLLIVHIVNSHRQESFAKHVGSSWLVSIQFKKYIYIDINKCFSILDDSVQ